MVFFDLRVVEKRGNTTSRVPPTSRDPSIFSQSHKAADDGAEAFALDTPTLRGVLLNELPTLMLPKHTKTCQGKRAMKSSQSAELVLVV